MLLGSSLLVFVVVVLFGQCQLGSSVTIDVTTQYHDGVIPNAFNIRCTPQTQGNCAKSIISIQLTKDGDKNIVNLQGGDSLTYNRLMESSLKVEGHIDKDLSKTYLSVTVNNAVKEDSGLYTCKLLYIDESLQFKFVTTSSNVTVTDQDTQDIIKHLMSKISFLENLVQFQHEELSNVKTAMVEQGTQLQSNSNEAKQSVTSLGEKVTALETEAAAQRVKMEQQKNHFEVELQEQKTVLTNQIQNLEQRLTTLSDKVNTTVSFTALHTRSGDFSNGKNLTFGHVVENIGDGYNGQTGVFTAPMEGYYMLQISLVSNLNKYMEIDLKSSTSRTLVRLAAGEPQWQDYTLSSCVARLREGEQVWPVIRSASGGYSFWARDTPDIVHQFYGYLLRKL